MAWDKTSGLPTLASALCTTWHWTGRVSFTAQALGSQPSWCPEPAYGYCSTAHSQGPAGGEHHWAAVTQAL